ncbi:hypothetical protein B0H11DRAFT_2365510 [Mycena galericulata]|nr:hypothetical protein B0H11DRAFT_2365510 [Mycena galericulata]
MSASAQNTGLALSASRPFLESLSLFTPAASGPVGDTLIAIKKVVPAGLAAQVSPHSQKGLSKAQAAGLKGVQGTLQLHNGGISSGTQFVPPGSTEQVLVEVPAPALGPPSTKRAITRSVTLPEGVGASTIPAGAPVTATPPDPISSDRATPANAHVSHFSMATNPPPLRRIRHDFRTAFYFSEWALEWLTTSLSLQPRPPGQHTPLKIHKGLLENRRDTNGQALLQVSVVGNIDRSETSLTRSGGIEEHQLQAALATHTVQIPIPGSVRLVENYAELYPSNRWMDTTTYLHSTQTISEACSAALSNHDYTYYMDESDKMWLDNTNYQCRVEERIAQEPRSADTQGICGRSFISEDEFELVMGLFETLTGPQLHQELPDFSIFKPFFLAPLHPDTSASHVVPSWIRPPSVLSSIALTIYPHWHQRCSLRGGRKICPSLNV